MSGSSNPLVSQGTLNRLRASVTVPSFPQLNANPSFLGKAGISLSLQGGATAMLQAMTGVVTSPEPYMMASVRITLLKSQSLAGLWKTQMELLSTIGPITVRPDAASLPLYNFDNCAIETVGDQTYNGSSPDWLITVSGIYYINASLYAGA